MPSRYRSRQHALQILYFWDMRRLQGDEIRIPEAANALYGALLEAEGDPEEHEPLEDRDTFAEDLATGTAAQTAALDELIARHSQHWRVERMQVLDRNILRLAAYEMKNMATPGAVVIDQALELARRFSGDDSIAFLNGVLDAINQELYNARSRS